MQPARERSGLWRDIGLMLAVWALALQMFVPSGTMVSNENGRAVVVICTGHGPLTVTTGGGKAPAPMKKTSDRPCAFAGHAAPYTAPLATPVADRAFTPIEDRGPSLPASLTPGRGLAAPPPPSRGPPGLLI